MTATARFRKWGKPFHSWAEYSGPWIENAWISTFCCDKYGAKPSTQNEEEEASISHLRKEPHRRHGLLKDTFSGFIPLFIQWTDLGAVSEWKDDLEAISTVLAKVLRPDVLYVTVSQHDQGLTANGMANIPPNILVFSGGGVGHVPIPLLKGTEAIDTAIKPPSSQLYTLMFAGSVHLRPLRQRMVQQILRATVPADKGRRIRMTTVEGGNLTTLALDVHSKDHYDYVQYRGGDWMMGFRYSKFVLTPRCVSTLHVATRCNVIDDLNSARVFTVAWVDQHSPCLLRFR